MTNSQVRLQIGPALSLRYWITDLTKLFTDPLWPDTNTKHDSGYYRIGEERAEIGRDQLLVECHLALNPVRP